MAHYHFRFGSFQSYIGGGPVYMIIFKAEDGTARGLKVRNSVGLAAQVGADYVLARHWALFMDGKKAHLRTDATATLGGAPITADIRLDPLVLVGCLSYRF